VDSRALGRGSHGVARLPVADLGADTSGSRALCCSRFADQATSRGAEITGAADRFLACAPALCNPLQSRSQLERTKATDPTLGRAWRVPQGLSLRAFATVATRRRGRIVSLTLQRPQARPTSILTQKAAKVQEGCRMEGAAPKPARDQAVNPLTESQAGEGRPLPNRSPRRSGRPAWCRQGAVPRLKRPRFPGIPAPHLRVLSIRSGHLPLPAESGKRARSPETRALRSVPNAAAAAFAGVPAESMDRVSARA
jgi:hypothetical protein